MVQAEGHKVSIYWRRKSKFFGEDILMKKTPYFRKKFLQVMICNFIKYGV